MSPKLSQGEAAKVKELCGKVLQLSTASLLFHLFGVRSYASLPMTLNFNPAKPMPLSLRMPTVQHIVSGRLGKASDLKGVWGRYNGCMT